MKQNKTLGVLALASVEVWSCKPKGRTFDSQPGHMPGLLLGPWLGRVQEATD